MATFKEEIQKSKADGTCKVMIRMTHNRKLKRIPTPIFIDKKNVTKSGRIKDQSVIDEIERLLRFYRKKCNKLSFTIDTMSIDDLYHHLMIPEKEHIDFLQYFRTYIHDNAEKKGITNYKSTYNALYKFTNKPELYINEITDDFLKELEASIKGVRAVSLYMSSIKTVFTSARDKYNDEERGIIRIPYNPFKKYKVPKQNIAEKRALEAQIMKAIYELPYQTTTKGRILENRRNLAKDMFILSFCLIGMNSADLYQCSQCDNGTLIYNRAKTKDRRKDKAEIHVDIPPIVTPIYQRYKDPSKKRVFKFHTKYANTIGFNMAINLGLKEIAKEIGLNTLQFYAARHSWATIARNDLGIDKATIHEALNHVDNSYTITDLYIKKNFVAINKANKEVIQYVFGEKEINK